MNTTKGQMIFQHLLLSAVIFLSLIVLLYGSMTYFNAHYRTSQAESSLQSLSITANTIYNLRPGSEDTIAVNIPPGVQDSAISGNRMSMKLNGFVTQDSQEIDVETIPQLVGHIPTDKGRHHVSVKVLNEHIVRIGDGVALFTITPSPVTIIDMPLFVTLFGDELVKGLEVLVDGVAYPFGDVNYIDSNYVEFRATPGLLPVGTYEIGVQNPNGDISNTLELVVV